MYASFAIAFSWLGTLVFYDLAKTLALAGKNGFGTKVMVSGLKSLCSMDFQKHKNLILLALPLGGVIGLISLNSNIPKYFISDILGNEMLGIFAAVSYVVMAGRLIDISIGQTIAPKLAEYTRDNKKSDFIRLNLYFFLLGIGICLSSIVVVFYFGEYILALLYTREFANYNNIFLILVLSNGVAWTFSFLNHAMIVFRQTSQQFAITIITTLSLLVLSGWLIPLKGLLGASVSILIASFIPVPLRLIFVYNAFKNHFSKGNEVRVS
jgi:O-antigen/teichoic acid export membrane protein